MRLRKKIFNNILQYLHKLTNIFHRKFRKGNSVAYYVTYLLPPQFEIVMTKLLKDTQTDRFEKSVTIEYKDLLNIPTDWVEEN